MKRLAIAAACVALLGMLLACGVNPRPVDVGVEPKEGEKPKKGGKGETPWAEARTTAAVGHARISTPYASVGTITGQRGAQVSDTDALWVKVRIENTSATKQIRWGGWQGQGKAEDEHGNVLRPLRFGFGFGFLSMPSLPDKPEVEVKGEAITDGSKVIDPGTSAAAFLFFEKPAPVSKEVRLTMPLSVLGDKEAGDVRFKIPISRR